MAIFRIFDELPNIRVVRPAQQLLIHLFRLHDQINVSTICLQVITICNKKIRQLTEQR